MSEEGTSEVSATVLAHQTGTHHLQLETSCTGTDGIGGPTRGWSGILGVGSRGRKELAMLQKITKNLSISSNTIQRRKKNIQQSSLICSDRPRTAEYKRNVPSCPCALYSGSALDSEHNKHTSLPQCVPGTMLDPGYQVTETWPLGESAQGH